MCKNITFVTISIVWIRRVDIWYPVKCSFDVTLSTPSLSVKEKSNQRIDIIKVLNNIIFSNINKQILFMIIS